jgi:NADPH2:quinone reductase
MTTTTPTEQATMKALVFAGPADDASQTSVATGQPVPDPGPGQVSIDVTHAGINFKDVMMRRGQAGYGDAWPIVPGMEVAGTVRAVGAGVDRVEVGDRVTSFTNAGGLAEVAVTDAALVARVPDGLALEVAAVAPGALTTAALLLDFAGRVREGDVVLVHSAGGGVGQALAQLAKARGVAQVIGTVGDERRAAVARDAGYDAVVVRGEGLADAIRAAANGRDVDVILDPIGTTYLGVDRAVAAPGGRIVIFGNATGEAPAALPSMGELMGANLSIGGFSITSLSAQAPERVREALDDVLALLSSGALTVDLKVVDGLGAAGGAHDALAAGNAPGKLVVRVA